MTTRGGSLVVVGVLALGAGCVDEELIDGYFTPEQWAHFQTELRLPPAPTDCPPPGCGNREWLGQQLFFDDTYSDAKSGLPDPQRKKVSCATCHDPRGWFVNTTASSQGTGWTKRNAISLVNIAYRDHLGRSDRYLWDGSYDTLASVIEVPLTKAAVMNSTPLALAIAIANGHEGDYISAFGALPPALPRQPPTMPLDPMQEQAVDEVYANAKTALAMYEMKLVTPASRFDLHLDGTEPFTPEEQHGYGLFTSFCVDCHHGPLLADEQFHNIGVAQRGEHAAVVDGGVGGFDCPSDPAGCPTAGQFRTPSLRNAAMTPPFMHAGQLGSLADVVAFYNYGGDPGGYVGVKDERIRPLDMSDDDLHDLEAFLRTLTSPTVSCSVQYRDGICPAP